MGNIFRLRPLRARHEQRAADDGQREEEARNPGQREEQKQRGPEARANLEVPRKKAESPQKSDSATGLSVARVLKAKQKGREREAQNVQDRNPREQQGKQAAHRGGKAFDEVNQD